MLATLGDKPFDDDGWIFEIKWDGYRAVAEVGKGDLKLYSRNGLSFAGTYPSVANELSKIKKEAILDGEIVALDSSGRADFQRLQNNGQSASTLAYYIFDCLSFQSKDITHLPLLERKKYIEKILPKNNSILRYSDHITAEGIAFFEKVAEKGLEGMMAKQSSSVYTTGKRTHDWLKIKNQNTQEAVIAGFTAPRNSRKYFGALILGVYEKKKFRFIGHTGTGFTEKDLKSVFESLKPLVQESSPFENKIPMKEKVTWVKPELVCNIKFSEITNDGILRHPVFQGFRIDKSAKEVDHVDIPLAQSKSKAKHTVKTKATDDSNDQNNKVEKIGGKSVTLTHLDKVFWPDEKITKGEVIRYYQSVAKYILPYLKDRPQSLKRNPGGILEKGFFHKDAAGTAPEWVDHISLHSETANKKIDYILCNSEATLIYLNNLGCIEINPWNSKVKTLDNPDYLILDIDPSDKNNFNQVVETANVIRDILNKGGAQGYPKTSGATGMHVYIPLHAAYTYEQIRIFAEGLASLVVEQLPQITTIERSLSKRKNRIYVDYLQNKRGQTLSSVYSLRPVPGATVSVPLDWKEVKAGLHPSQFTIYNTLERIKRKGDLFEPVLKEKINLEKCIKNLGF